MIKVILKERVEHLGRSGDIVTVKDGYARNYLLPKGYAIQADDKSIKYVEHHKKMIQKKVDAEKKDQERVAELINAKTYTIERKLSSETKLYGSVTANDIYELLVADGFNIYKKDVSFASTKLVGEYKATIDLGHGISAELTVIVKGDGTGFTEDSDTKEVAGAEETAETEEVAEKTTEELTEAKE